MGYTFREFLRDILAIRNVLIVIITPIVLLPIPISIQSKESECAYVVIIMAVYWVTEALPIAVTALLPIILFPMVGMMSAKDVSSKFVNDTTMLFLGGLVIAAAIEHWNIHKRIALRIILIVGSEPHWLMLGMMLPTWFLSMWISNTATTAMMIPIANAVLVQLRDAKQTKDTTTFPEENGIDNKALELEEIAITEKQGEVTLKESDKLDAESPECDDVSEDNKAEAEYLRMCKALSLAIAYSANVGGIGSLTGTGPNIVMKGQSDIVFQKYGAESPVTFATWMQFGLPLSAVCLVILWVWLQIYFMRCKSCFSCFSKQDKSTSRRVTEMLRKAYDELGPITFAQGAVMAHFLLLAILWISRDLGGVGGWGDLFPEKTVTDSTPSILISASLFLFPSEIPSIFRCGKSDDLSTGQNKASEKVAPLLSWKVAEKNIPWGVIWLLGGGFALAEGSQVSGLSAWLGDKLAVFSSFEPWVMNLILCYIVAAATEVTSNTAICTLMMPIMAELALKLGVNPLYLMFPTAIATSFAFMLPVATPPNAVVFSYGYVKVIDMVTAGFFMNIVAVLVLVGATESWGESIFHFHTEPDFFKNSTLTLLNTTVNSTFACLCPTTALPINTT
ncbi:solute carrier family 13 member 2-like [Mizuhopecten yessoensis]|uniref:Solute carrier family 13 member 2 n=1 Tax=Mizuhopecten yessoensis TaxID=6573 RepID=A0A210QNF7_MIZYE|nr:solute carrier family 13 member 2-like [Mizuhopecten yessoensis]OWF50269.1 Solute carrier family 13 member 2 [Mizuhopecten yessoensis]